MGTPVPGAGHKVIHSGQSVVVYHLYSLDPNCRSLGHYEITLLTQPHGGVVQTSAALDYPNFPQSNVRWVCDRRRSASDQIVYRASPGFTGEDSFEVEAISPEHNARRYQFSVTVE